MKLLRHGNPFSKLATIECNKALNEKEYTAIKKLVDEAENPFIASDYGFWYQYVQKNEIITHQNLVIKCFTLIL